jgi:hypothetical protein
LPANTVVLPNQAGHSFTLHSRPTTLQEAFQLLGIDQVVEKPNRPIEKADRLIKTLRLNSAQISDQ